MKTKPPTEAEKQHACDTQVIRDREHHTFAQPRKPDTASHSPLPWALEGAMKITSGIRYTANCFVGSERAAELEESKANADYIVRACNNAQRLADALNDALPWLAKANGSSVFENCALPLGGVKAEKRMREALAEWNKAQ